jgi:hypothetical protein
MKLLNLSNLSVYLFISISIFVSNPVVAKQYDLTPRVGLGPPVDEGVKITFEAPLDWQPWTKMNDAENDFERVFALSGHADEEHPAIQLSVQAWVPGKLLPGPAKPIDRRDPKNSSTVTDMQTAAPIEDVRKIGSFEAGENGKLPIWQIRSKAYDCLLVLVVYRNTSVDICLRGDDASDLRKYIPDLKEIARSVRFLKTEHQVK